MHTHRSRTPRHPRRLFAGVLLVGCLFVLAACGGSSDHSGMASSPAPATSAAGPAASGPHNAADVTFATDMIPHHAQALEMAKLAGSKATDGEVKALAAAIAEAQEPEIKTMTGWLQGWGAPIPATEMMQGMSMPGMTSADDMAKLEAATGAKFDRMWVAMMTEHHQGAVAMSRTELAAGQNEQAQALATQIIKAQTAEITTLSQIAKRLG